MANTDTFVGGEPTPGPLHPDRQIAATMLFDEAPTVTDEFQARPKSARERDMITAFTTLTGYKERDLIGVNEVTLTIVTASGGKYQLNRAMDRFRTLSGPAAPRAKRAKAKPAATGRSATNIPQEEPPNEDTEE